MRQFPQGMQSNQSQIDRQAVEIAELRRMTAVPASPGTTQQPSPAIQWTHNTDKGREQFDAPATTQ